MGSHFRPGGGRQPGELGVDLEHQVQLTIAAIKTILSGYRCNLSHVVEVTVDLVAVRRWWLLWEFWLLSRTIRRRAYTRFDRAYAAAMGDNKPTRKVVFVKGLPHLPGFGLTQAQVEITCRAFTG